MKRIISAIIAAIGIITQCLMISAFATLPGDVNTDGKVNSTDALIVLNYSVGIDKNKLTSTQLLLADYNNDKKINSADALAILVYATSGKNDGEAGEGNLGD